MTKIFEWAQCTHSPQMKAFLMSVENSGISEAAFVERYIQIPYSGPKRHCRSRGANKARSDYQRLAKYYDFFAPKA
jgi:hypothetical protein